MIAPRWAFRLLWAVDRALDRITGGRIDAWKPGPKTLRLTTVGRKSGEPRVNGVYYIDLERGWAIVPSNAGSPRDPAWWLNLQAKPEASVRIGQREHTVRSRVATADEERDLWPRLHAANPAYREYRAAAGRPIPIVILERTGP